MSAGSRLRRAGSPAHWVLVLLATLVVLPLIRYGPSCGHDFDFHLVNWMEAARQFRHGDFHPQWAYSPAWNAGEPRFVFYPPASWTLGGALGLLFPLAWIPAIYTWIAVLASGLTMHSLARRLVPRGAALIAAAFYLANPYMLFTAYERTAYAELLAAAWIPMLFGAILSEEVAIVRVALPIALLWITNAPAAVMSCYAAALLTILRIVLTLSKPQKNIGLAAASAWRTATGAGLGLGLASFYLVPAAYERRYVQIAMAVIPSLRIEDNTLFHHTGDPARDAVILTASLLAVLLLGLTTVLVAKASLRRGRRDVLVGIGFLTLVLAFLLSRAALPVWHHLPEMAFLQFPWRTLALQSCVAGLALALAMPLEMRLRRSCAAACLMVAVFVPTCWHLFRQDCETTPARQVAQIESDAGSEPTDEYTPVSADNDSLTQRNPPFWLGEHATAQPPDDVTSGRRGETGPHHLQILSGSSRYLVLNLRDFPAWSIRVNGTLLTSREERDDGLVAIALPSGEADVLVRWQTLPDHWIGLGITLVCAVVLVILRWQPSFIIKP